MSARTWVAMSCLGAVLAVVGASAPSAASDHSDTSRLADLGRDEARLADFYVFRHGDQLVLAITIAADLPTKPEHFRFPDDVVYRFHIDRNPKLTTVAESTDPGVWTVVTDPATIREDLVIELRFGAGGTGATASAKGLRRGADNALRWYAGVRDDPFIRSVVAGRNVAAIVVELSLANVVTGNDHAEIVAWSTADVLDIDEAQDELAATPYRSQAVAEQRLNTLHPSEHRAVMNLPPNILIYDTRQSARFPNGRALVDDVVTLLRRPVDPPHPTENDVLFLDAFPYLAPPHVAP